MRPLIQAPLPQWRTMVKAIFGVASDNELATPWLRSGESAFWFSRSAWSLAALASWRMCLLEKKTVYVWVPDFFCNATLGPLRETGARLIFYPVTDDMAPNLNACQNLAKHYPVDLFVLVHYFGQATSTEIAVSFCKKYHAWLIEDAVHVLRPITGVGEIGDCVLYSPHKHLPIPDGALLVVRPNGPAQISISDASMNLLKEVQSSLLSMPGRSSRSTMLWLLKRLAQRLGFRVQPRLLVFKASEGEGAGGVIAHPSMSVLARRLLTPLRTRLQVVADHRKRNAQAWFRILKLMSVKDSAINYQVAATPYLAGFTAGDTVKTQIIFDLLQRAGLPVTTWPDLPPEVLQDAERHSVAVSLRHSFLYLPVHQSISESQILRLGVELARNIKSNWVIEPVTLSVWEGVWRTCFKANLLQSWQYGESKAEAEGWKPHRLLISDGNNQPIALVQVLTKGLPLLGFVARINRGPLLLRDFAIDEKLENSILAIKVVLDYARIAGWRMLQIAPELPETDWVVDRLRLIGLHRVTGDVWGSSLLALNGDEKSLLMGLKGKWRNCLRKGERLGVSVVRHSDGSSGFESLKQSYADLQAHKGFEGISIDMLRAMLRQDADDWQFNIFSAYIGDGGCESNEIGHLLSIQTGNTATYLIGSVSEKGRVYQANSVLLWNAIMHAKKSGCLWFDLGGISNATPKGIADFKLGINAEPYNLVGEWRKWSL